MPETEEVREEASAQPGSSTSAVQWRLVFVHLWASLIFLTFSRIFFEIFLKIDITNEMFVKNDDFRGVTSVGPVPETSVPIRFRVLQFEDRFDSGSYLTSRPRFRVGSGRVYGSSICIF